MIKKTLLLLFLAHPVFANTGVWIYSVQGYIDCKTKSLRDTTYNTMIKNISNDTLGWIDKSDFLAQSGTVTANAFYRINICVNYLLKDIDNRTAIEVIVSGIKNNTNLLKYNVQIFNSYCKTAQEASISDISEVEYNK